MSVTPSLHATSAIVTRLRAAGCVFAEDEANLLVAEAATPTDLAAMVNRRVAGEPLEHVLGWAEFCGLRIAVDSGVFVPRRRTEFLVSQAVLAFRAGAALQAGPALAADNPGPASSRPAVVVDLCCGSGAVGVALVTALSRAGMTGVGLHAVDIEAAAVRCARRNVGAVGGTVYEGDLDEPLPDTLRGEVAILVANAPYVPTGEVGLMPTEARLHEPMVALDGGADGLAVVRRVAAAAPQWLAPGGSMLVETSERQAARAAEAVSRNGLLATVTSSDEFAATVVIGTRGA